MWSSHQYGRDYLAAVRKLSDVITVALAEPIPWTEVRRLAATELDLVLVVGNRDVRQLPSKAVEYLTLPIPRLALTSGQEGDALTAYVETKPGCSP